MKYFMKAFIEQLSHCYGLIMLMKDQAYWALVFVLTYIHKPTARRLALRWANKLREKIIKKHKAHPEDIDHLGKQSEDNISLSLAVIERFKTRCRQDYMQVRFEARIHLKGRGLIIERGLKWVNDTNESASKVYPE